MGIAVHENIYVYLCVGANALGVVCCIRTARSHPKLIEHTRDCSMQISPLLVLPRVIVAVLLWMDLPYGLHVQHICTISFGMLLPFRICRTIRFSPLYCILTVSSVAYRNDLAVGSSCGWWWFLCVMLCFRSALTQMELNIWLDRASGELIACHRHNARPFGKYICETIIIFIQEILCLIHSQSSKSIGSIANNS